MAAPARVIDNGQFTLTESVIVPVADTIVLDGIDSVKPHCFIGVQFFADVAGEAEATPSAGTIGVQIGTINTFPNLEDPPSGTITAATPTTLSWAANTQTVTAIPTGIVGAAFWRVRVTSNET